MRNRRVLGIIPARGGSKGVPNKNITELLGKPLITYTIAAALESEFLTSVVVSTDDSVIAEISKKAGAQVPFIRPDSLSQDSSLSLPVVMHALRFMEAKEGLEYDAVMMLQPTAPLRTSVDIDEAIKKIFSSGADSVISVSNVEANHPLRMKKVDGDKLLNYVDQGFEDMRPRQQLPDVYIRNGAIYLALRATLTRQLTFSGDDCRAYIMPEERSINLDARRDFVMAEYYLQNIRDASV